MSKFSFFMGALLAFCLHVRETESARMVAKQVPAHQQFGGVVLSEQQQHQFSSRVDKLTCCASAKAVGEGPAKHLSHYLKSAEDWLKAHKPVKRFWQQKGDSSYCKVQIGATFPIGGQCKLKDRVRRTFNKKFRKLYPTFEKDWDFTCEPCDKSDDGTTNEEEHSDQNGKEESDDGTEEQMDVPVEEVDAAATAAAATTAAAAATAAAATEVPVEEAAAATEVPVEEAAEVPVEEAEAAAATEVPVEEAAAATEVPVEEAAAAEEKAAAAAEPAEVESVAATEPAVAATEEVDAAATADDE